MDAVLSPLQLLGFLLAAWAVIGNDSLQTLGPFLQANRGRTPRWLQALALCAVLCGVLLLGWWRNGGDASWGRLAAYPEPSLFGWVELLPPLAVLLLTQVGVPVSTSFLVLTAFTPANLPALLRRSLFGYGLALAVGLLVYGAVVLWLRWWRLRSAEVGGDPPRSVGLAGTNRTQAAPDLRAAPAGSSPRGQELLGAGPLGSAGEASGDSLADAVSRSAPISDALVTALVSAAPSARNDAALARPDGLSAPAAQRSRPAGGFAAAARPELAAGTALALQWLASGWLWSQWLIQDLANLFIYLPRHPSGGAMALALAVLCLGVWLLLAESGGAIQAILRRKSDLGTPLASAALSLVYGLILALLAVWGREPLSTTWVFLGLLAGRELALLLQPQPRPLVDLALDLGRDLALAALGLAVSLVVALAVQPLRGLG